MLTTKQYQPEDYKFTDKDGNTYISTPEYDIIPDLIFIYAIAMMMPTMIGLTIYLTL